MEDSPDAARVAPEPIAGDESSDLRDVSISAATPFGQFDRPSWLIEGTLDVDVNVKGDSDVQVRVDFYQAGSPDAATKAGGFDRAEATLVGSTSVAAAGGGEVEFRGAIAAGALDPTRPIFAVAHGPQIRAERASAGFDVPRARAEAPDARWADADGDGVPESIESPAGDAVAGRASDASTAARAKADEASIPALADGAPLVTIAAPGLTLKDARVEAAPDPDADARLPLGVFGFEVHGVAPGGSAQVRVALPRGTGADAYYKIDPTTGEPIKFDFDGTTGAVIDGDAITLHLVDGGRGDADGVANGVIVDPGGPGTYVCQTVVDVMLALDGSGSISAANFNLMKDFARQLITKFTVGNLAARFGVIQFSGTGQGRYESFLSGDAAALDAAIAAMTQVNGGTDIREGLALARTELADHGRIDAPDAVILLTDGGHYGTGDPKTEADALKLLGVDVFGIGVGSGANMTTINAIASDPDSSHAFPVTNFTTLVASVNNISDTVCCGTTVLGSIAGSVYRDDGADGVRGPNDPGIAGATIVLQGVDQFGQPVRRTRSTGADGGYRFDQVQPGTYSLTEVQPPDWLDALDSAGTSGGTAGDDRIQGIALRPGANAAGYDFGEHSAPVFSTTPPTDVKSGGSYSYDADAADWERDGISYSLIQGPAGLSANAATGVLTWSPTAADVGNHAVVLRASDGRGGVAQQAFTLNVLSGHPNRPPRFSTTAIVDARVGIPYVYQAKAIDPDGDAPLTFDLVSGPAGLAVSATGLVTWTPTDAQLGPQSVVVRVSDNRSALPNAGGVELQAYTILVRQSPENRPPLIVSQPITVHRPQVASPTATLYAKVRDLRGGQFGIEPGFVSGRITGMVENVLGQDGTPTPIFPRATDGIVPDAAFFHKWYHDIPYENLSTIVPLTFAETSPGSGTYAFNNGSFFPINGQLFGNEPYGGTSNFYFTAEVRSTFTYKASAAQTFQVTSDDDSWVFIDGKLAVDNGGIHAPVTASVGLNTLGLVDGQTYSLDVFFAERMTGASHLAFQSNFPLEPARYLYDVDAVDPDNDPISYSLVSGPAAMSINPKTGMLAWNPTSAQVGSYSVVVQAADGRGGFDRQTFTLNVVNPAPNVAPVVQSSAPDRVIIGEAFAYKVRATDADGDPVRYSLLGGPAGMLINQYTGEITWQTTPTTLPGSYSVSVSALDGRGGVSAPHNFTILATRFSNGDPTFVTPPAPPSIGTVGQRINYQVIATDPEDDRLYFDLPVRPAGMVVDSTTGALAWTPDFDQVGTFDVIVRARDPIGGVALLAFQILVGDGTNHPPMIVSTPSSPALRNRAYKYQLAVRDPDAVDTTFTYSFAATPPTGMTVNSSGLIQWTPTAVGNYRVAVQVADPRGGSTVQSFVVRVDVDPGNRPPTITSTPRLVVRKGDLYLYSVQGSDPDSDALTYTASIPAAASSAGMVFDSANRLLKWPAAGAAGAYGPITITVSDGRGGTYGQTFQLQVANQDSNQEPVITSLPSREATYGWMFAYDAAALDPDGDPIEWDLVSGPDGMVVDPTRGAVRWTPRADQVGTQRFVVRARDPKGGFSTQAVDLTVRGANLPPQITSAPLTRIKTQTAYSSIVTAVDPDGRADDLVYNLIAAPGWLTIDYKTHAIAGNAPNVSTPTAYTVQVQVEDGRGGVAVQTFSIVVEPTLNRPPTITSNPAFAALAGASYQYPVTASDPDGGTLTYSKAGSTPAWLTINASTGLLQGTPPAGTATYSVTVKATDAGGAWAEQTYTLSVRSNSAPTITPTAQPSLTAGMNYRHDVVATDPDGDALTYQFVGSPPAGMTIDPLKGRISWATTTAQAGQSFPVTVRVVDSFGAASADHAFTVVVAADSTAPSVTLQYSVNPAPINSQVRFLVTASDEVGVAGITLTVAGQGVVLDGNGAATVTMGSTVGSVTVTATARDAAGNVGTFQPVFTLYDPTDLSAPTVSIAAPAADDTITAPVNVTGSVADPQLTSWTLDVAPLRGGVWTVIGTGTAAVTNGTLGLLDPTVLANGPYTLRLTARDSGGHVASAQKPIHVDGNLKIGNLKLSVVDLTVPVAGIPITVSRSYDTLNALEYGEVGYGWRLDFGDMDVKVSIPDSTLGAFDDVTPFRDGARVTITGPDGAPQRFTFQAVPSSGFFGIVTGYRPVFVPDPDVLATLTVPAVELMKVGTEYISLDAGGIPYNPAHPAFGASYTLRTREGLSHTIDANTGKLLSLSDRNQNTLKYRDDGIFSDSGRAITFTRDAQGRITALIDPRGNSVVYAYNAVGDLVSVRDREDNLVQMTYAAGRPHFLEKVIDPTGKTSAQMAYNAQGRVSTITDAAGKAVTNTYVVDATTRTQTVADQLNKSSTTTFDVLGNVTKVVDAGNKTTKFAYLGKKLASKTRVVGLDDASSGQADDLTTSYDYSAVGDLKAITDAMGRKTRMTYDAYGQPKTVTTPTGETITSAYDPRTGNLLSQVDAAGNLASYSYDSHGNVTRVVSGLDGTNWFYGDPASQPNAVTTQSVYDPFGQTTQATDSRGSARTFSYDANGNATGSQYVWTNPANPADQRTVSTINVYDKNDRLKSAAGPNGATTTDYDALGRPWRTTNELGGQTTTTYDVRGLPIQVQTPDGRISRTVYDAKGRAVWADDPHLPAQQTAGTWIEYDDLDRVKSTKRYAALVIDLATTGGVSSTSLGSSTTQTSTKSTAYDDAGRVVQSTDASNHVVSYEYDAAGRQTAVVDVVGGVTRRTETDYDAAGRATKSRDALGRETVTVYDANGRAVKTIFADSTSVETEYDRLGHRVASTDQMGWLTNYEYDRLGNLTAVVLPPAFRDPATTNGYLVLAQDRVRYEYSYDAYGNLAKVKDPLGRETKYEYDQMGRKVKATLPMGQSETWRYDALGRMDRHVDFNGKVEKLAYDSLGRLSIDSFHDSEAGAAVDAITYAYDSYAAADGVRKDSVVDSRHGTTERYFDREGLMVKVVTPEGTIRYEYDPATGRKKRVYTGDTLAAAQTDLTYDYDDVGRLWKVTAWKLNGSTLVTALVTQYAYNLLDLPTSTSLPNGTSETRTYDLLNRLKSVATTRSADNAVLASFVYTLDAGGRRTAVDEIGGRRVEYGYDPLGRLVTERTLVGGTQTEGFRHDYDVVGNRLKRTTTAGSAPTMTFAYDDNDRLIYHRRGFNLYNDLTYDAAGNLLTQQGDWGQQITNEWDRAGRLWKTTVDGALTTYIYNSQGIRTQAVGGVTTKYLIDETEAYDQVLEEYAPNGVLAATYVRGLDLLFQDRAGTRTYAVKDGLGSVRAMTNTATPATVTVTDTFTYDAYGNQTARTGSTIALYRFAGEGLDATGNYYLRARYYSPVIARFTSKDALSKGLHLPYSFNTYSYANSNPTLYTDPSGNDGLISIGVSMAIGATIGTIDAALGGQSLYIGFRNGAAFGLAAGVAAPLMSLKVLVGVNAFFTVSGAVDSFYHERYTQGVFRVGLGLFAYGLMLRQALMEAQALDSAQSNLASQIELLAHIKELGTDVATGGFRIGEAESALGLETLVGPLARSRHDGYDVHLAADASKHIDLIGALEAPVKTSPSFNFNQFLNGIKSKITNKPWLWRVAVDATHFNPQQKAQIIDTVNSLPAAQQSRVIVFDRQPNS